MIMDYYFLPQAEEDKICDQNKIRNLEEELKEERSTKTSSTS
jgi:hypothetical protein